MVASDQQSGRLRSRVRQQDVVAELGQQALESSALDRLIENATAAVGGALEVVYARTESLPRVYADPGQVRRVFQNLLDNAITYSGGESPRISVFAEKRGDEWTLSVRDRGIGLALCRRIVERHGVRASEANSAGSRSESAGGEITVDSTPGEGSTVSVVLPAPPAADSPTGTTNEIAARDPSNE